jgi:hypothetical protein
MTQPKFQPTAINGEFVTLNEAELNVVQGAQALESFTSVSDDTDTGSFCSISNDKDTEVSN